MVPVVIRCQRVLYMNNDCNYCPISHATFTHSWIGINSKLPIPGREKDTHFNKKILTASIKNFAFVIKCARNTKSFIIWPFMDGFLFMKYKMNGNPLTRKESFGACMWNDWYSAISFIIQMKSFDNFDRAQFRSKKNEHNWDFIFIKT